MNIELFFPNFTAMPTTITNNYYGQVIPHEIDRHLAHSSTAALRVWRVKVLKNEFSHNPKRATSTHALVTRRFHGPVYFRTVLGRILNIF